MTGQNQQTPAAIALRSVDFLDVSNGMFSPDQTPREMVREFGEMFGTDGALQLNNTLKLKEQEQLESLRRMLKRDEMMLELGLTNLNFPEFEVVCDGDANSSTEVERNG